MALSRSLLEYGHDEVRDDGITDICSYCATDGKLQPGLHFCFDCGVFGRYICGVCLKNHNKFVNNHDVEKIANQSTSSRKKENDSKVKALEQSNGELQKDKNKLQKENDKLLIDVKDFKKENEKLKKELRDSKIATDGIKTKIDEFESKSKRNENRFEDKVKERDDRISRLNENDTKAKPGSELRVKDKSKQSMNMCVGVARLKRKEKPVVAAIFIGNSSSTYAFSLKYDQSKVEGINWVDSTSGIPTIKCPTVVLFDRNKKFHSFGYEAEKAYADMALDDEHHDWYIFRCFMSTLLEDNVVLHHMVVEDNGKKMKAIDVLTAVIKYLKDHCLNTFSKRSSGVQTRDVHWVLPVPAIWTDTAKKIMREAAYKADIKDADLTIVSEPEAASLYCQMIPGETDSKSTAQLLSTPGIKFMVTDLGDCSADFTIFERQSDGSLMEVKAATVVACGVKLVENEFLGLIRNIVGGEIFQKFIDEHSDDYRYLQRELYEKITAIEHDSVKETLKVPISIVCYFQEKNNETIKQALERSQFKGKVIWLSDKVRIDADVIKDLYKPCTDKIVGHIKDLLKEQDARDTRTLLMVGTLAESPIVQETITRFFPNYNVIIPEAPSFVVMKGAVIYGHQH